MCLTSPCAEFCVDVLAVAQTHGGGNPANLFELRMRETAVCGCNGEQQIEKFHAFLKTRIGRVLLNQPRAIEAAHRFLLDDRQKDLENFGFELSAELQLVSDFVQFMGTDLPI